MKLINNKKQPVFQEEDLLHHAAQGDSEAFGRLYTHYQPKIFRFIHGMLNSRESSEEILQDIFADLWERRRTLSDIGSLNSYLYKMAKYKLINLHEHRKVQQKANAYLEYTLDGTSKAADEDLIFKGYKAIFTDAMDLLPVKRRKIFEMRNLQDLSHEEIALELNISKSMVKKQCYAASKHIKEHLFRKAGLIATYLIGILLTMLYNQ